MQPGDTISLTVMRQTAAGVASAGKVLADFSVAAYADGVSYDPSADIDEIETVGAWTTYKLTVTLETGGPYWSHIVVQPDSGTDVIAPNVFTGEVEQQDLDSTYSVVSRPTASLSTATLMASELQLEMIAYRANSLYIQIVNQAGAAVNLSGYDNWRFSVWDKTHSGTILFTDPLDLAGDASGNITAIIPEDAAFYSEIADAFTASEDFVTLYYDIIADEAADNDLTRTLARGRLILWRYEGAA